MRRSWPPNAVHEIASVSLIIWVSAEQLLQQLQHEAAVVRESREQALPDSASSYAADKPTSTSYQMDSDSEVYI